MDIDYDMWRRLMFMHQKKSTAKSYGMYMNTLKVKRRGGFKRR